MTAVGVRLSDQHDLVKRMLPGADIYPDSQRMGALIGYSLRVTYAMDFLPSQDHAEHAIATLCEQIRGRAIRDLGLRPILDAQEREVIEYKASALAMSDLAERRAKEITRLRELLAEASDEEDDDYVDSKDEDWREAAQAIGLASAVAADEMAGEIGRLRAKMDALSARAVKAEQERDEALAANGDIARLASGWDDRQALYDRIEQLEADQRAAVDAALGELEQRLRAKPWAPQWGRDDWRNWLREFRGEVSRG